MNRETGTETKPCPTCDRPLAVVANGDGSQSTVLCRDCYPQDLIEQAEKASAATPRETGTDVVAELELEGKE